MLTVLATSPRVAPGLLSWQAWHALRSASLVLAPPGHPQLPALAEAGIDCTIAEPPIGDGAPHTAAGVASWLAATAAAGGAAAMAAATGTGGARAVAPGSANHPAGDTIWLAPPEGGISPAGQPVRAALPSAELARELGRLLGADQVRVVAGSADLAGSRLVDLVQAMDRLRTECPWDARQTHESLAPHLPEETYEALEALESGDAQAFCEELGDVLLQVVFHARVAAERDDGTGFTADDVADAIVAKLVRRHPHVFSDVTVSGADEVQGNWDAIKRAEKRAKAERMGISGAAPAAPSVLDGVPFGQPALALAAQLQRRAERGGVPAELTQLDGDASPASGPGGADGEIGRELFRLVAQAGQAGVDPETALRTAARQFRDAVSAWEARSAADDA